MNKRNLLANVLDRTGIAAAAGLASRRAGLTVFNYHRIGSAAGTSFDPDLFSADEDQFDRQVRVLTRSCDVIGLADLADALSERRGRFGMITFDDGYRDNYEAAYPILRAHGATGVFFLTTGFLDGGGLAWWDEIAWQVHESPLVELRLSHWFDRPLSLAPGQRYGTRQALLQRYKSLPASETAEFLDGLGAASTLGRAPRSLARNLWMSWSEVREMSRHGMEFGAHTVMHPVLANLSADQQFTEIRQSRLRVEFEVGRRVTAFSYPVGQPESFSAVTQESLQRAGIQWAFSYYGGFNTNPCEPLNLRRVAVESDTSPALFRCTARMPGVFA